MTFRTFVALELPASLQDEIIKQTARLRQNLDGEMMRWVPAGNMHLTLKFLGDIPPAHLDFIKQSLTQIAQASPSFDLQISGLGSFPTPTLPRLLWVGVHAAAGLNAMQQQIESAMYRLGYQKEERQFSPHLTLAHVRRNLSPSEGLKIREALQTIQLGRIGTARVNSVHLFKSDLTPAGSEYTKLFSAKFKP